MGLSPIPWIFAEVIRLHNPWQKLATLQKMILVLHSAWLHSPKTLNHPSPCRGGAERERLHSPADNATGLKQCNTQWDVMDWLPVTQPKMVHARVPSVRASIGVMDRCLSAPSMADLESWPANNGPHGIEKIQVLLEDTGFFFFSRQVKDETD